MRCPVINQKSFWAYLGHGRRTICRDCRYINLFGDPDDADLPTPTCTVHVRVEYDHVMGQDTVKERPCAEVNRGLCEQFEPKEA